MPYDWEERYQDDVKKKTRKRYHHKNTVTQPSSSLIENLNTHRHEDDLSYKSVNNNTQSRYR